MTVKIRTFRNTDVAQLCDVWNAHNSVLGPECTIDLLRLELCSLAKPFFCEADLLVAEQEGSVVGWIHLAGLPNEDLSDLEPGAGAIAALCVVPGGDEDQTAAELLKAADQIFAERQILQYAFRPILPKSAFYLGCGPAGSMIGLTSTEVRIRRWLMQSNFKARCPTNVWELDLGAFQPPIDRQQIQIRRSAQVNRGVDEPYLPWWQACLLGHTEPNAFQLTHRIEKRVLHEILFWTVASELQTTPGSVAWMWPVSLPPSSEPSSSVPTPASRGTLAAPSSGDLEADRLVFLVGESLREFQNDRLDSVRTVSAANDLKMSGLLRRLGFTSIESGVEFEKRVE